MSSPNVARIASLSAWTKFFHPTEGVFRLPSTAGATIEHLDIDLRFVNHDPHFLQGGELYLPAVIRVTLRGGEYVQDCDERMESLSEVLCSVKPVEALWLNAFDDPAEQQTLATVLVHPAIIAAGELWQQGRLVRLVIQVPNLTAPTPYNVTPAVTPACSPGPLQRTFGSTPFSGLPSLSLNKPKPLDEAKIKEREERERLADYALKPRWEFAFGSWGAEEIRWKFDVAIKTIMSNFFIALNETFPSTSHKVHRDMPSLLTFSPIPIAVFTEIKDLTLECHRLAEHMSDVAFVSTNSVQFARLSDDELEVAYRQTKRLKAEVMLLHTGMEIVQPAHLAATDLSLAPMPHAVGLSPAHSMMSLSNGETDVGSDEDTMAQTPPMGSSFHLPAGPDQGSDMAFSKKVLGKGEPSSLAEGGF